MARTWSISQGFRARAAERVTLKLGPPSKQEIRAALENEVGAERGTSLDRSLRNISLMKAEESPTYDRAARAKIPSYAR